MNRQILAAWALGIGVLTWREVAAYHEPVPAGRYLAASGLYALLGLAATWSQAAPVAVAVAWGFDLALVLKPGFLPGTSSPATRTQKTGGGGTGAGHSGHGRGV